MTKKAINLLPLTKERDYYREIWGLDITSDLIPPTDMKDIHFRRHLPQLILTIIGIVILLAVPLIKPFGEFTLQYWVAYGMTFLITFTSALRVSKMWHQGEISSRTYRIGLAAWFPLIMDPKLSHLEIGARAIYWSTNVPPRLQIVFRDKNSRKEAAVHCTHTVILEDVPLDGVLNDSNNIFPTKTSSKQPQIPPVEHYLALRSYVQAIAEIGIETMLHTASEYINEKESLPVGFNSFMQKQVLEALRQVAPQSSNEIRQCVLVSLLEIVNVEWLKPRIKLLDSIYNYSAWISNPQFQAALSDQGRKRAEILIHYSMRERFLISLVWLILMWGFFLPYFLDSYVLILPYLPAFNVMNIILIFFLPIMVLISIRSILFIRTYWKTREIKKTRES